MPGSHASFLFFLLLCIFTHNVHEHSKLRKLTIFSCVTVTNLQEQLMKKVDEVDQENKALKEAGEEKDKEIQQLKAEMKALKKSCDAEVSSPGLERRSLLP